MQQLMDALENQLRGKKGAEKVQVHLSKVHWLSLESLENKGSVVEKEPEFTWASLDKKAGLHMDEPVDLCEELCTAKKESD